MTRRLPPSWCGGPSLRSRSVFTLVLAVVLCLAPVAARGDTPPGSDLDYKPALTIAATTLWLTTEFPLKRSLAPDSCRWCDRGEDGRDGLNGLDASMRGRFRWASPRSAAKISDVLLFAVVPAASVASIWIAADNDGRGNETGENALLMFEAIAVSAALNQAAKYTLARQRPYAHYAPQGAPPTSDDNLSFYSGHAAVTFTTSVAAGTIASMRGYGGASVVWIPGVVLASAASYLRLSCDRHYFTDVIAGVVIGTGVGIAVPRLLHGNADDDAPAGAAPALRARPIISFRWVW
ncbi:MAG TPA: phosphatase PAP2 family protein [Candidatus Eisenbacteria bacterium]|nr:phosphatase PAP2 family protein [Candidatus Eisenbacteria bacterium]